MSPAARTLPDSATPNLHITQPTDEEKKETWTLNSSSWGGALNQLDYLEREAYLTEAPLARDGGITHWILVDKGLPPNRRPILASCETLHKRALVSRDGKLTEVVCHGIGSVFCNPEYRGRGYASRMMRDLGEKLRTWQAGPQKTSGFSALWSDIGKVYYAGHGWHPFPSTHVEFPPASLPEKPDTASATILEPKDIQKLCEIDEGMIRQSLIRARDGKTHVCIIPDHEHMQWHHFREDFMCQKIFGEGKKPSTRGAIIGEPGSRVWAVWTRSFYGPLEAVSGNTLHILRVVVEDEVPESLFSSKTGGALSNGSVLDDQARKFKAVIQIAKAQAEEWDLVHVELWNPTSLVQSLIQRSGLQSSRIEREKDSIPSLMWYGEGSGKVEDLEWVGNEKFGWC